ncbi:hypothetical protein AHAS_Ahas02G0152400 [Arachis hypogaea]
MYSEQIIQEITNLKRMNELGNSGSIGGGIKGGRVLDLVGVHTKGTGCSNSQVETKGVKHRKCGTCGVVGHRRTRCLNQANMLDEFSLEQSLCFENLVA